MTGIMNPVTNTQTTKTTATAISAHLRRLGFLPSFDRKREGIRITAWGLDGVRVTADLDSDNAARRLMDDIIDAVKTAGRYSVTRTSDNTCVVTK